jgi:hypothetical protein
VGAGNFTVLTDEQITATVPAGAITAQISVDAPGGTATSSGSFSVIQPPTITGFSPASGPVGTVVTISGSGFDGATAVTLNGTSLTGITVVSDEQITATVPEGASSGQISVVGPIGTGTSTGSFSVIPPPTISGFSPASGGIGTEVTIGGTGLTWVTSVTLNGTDMTGLTVISDEQISATVPAGASSGQISVITPGGTATSTGSFSVIPPPTIGGFSPGSGPAGTEVTIDGTGFAGATDVRFGTTSVGAGNFTVLTDEQITATVPAGAITAPISVDAPGGTATSSGSFSVIQPPTITGFSPASGPVGTEVTINGSGFDGATAVRFGTTNVGAGSFTVVSDTQITATVPAGAITAPISIDAPGGTGTSTGNFAVTVTFTATADARIDLALPNSNFGSATSFSVDNKPVSHGLLKFDVVGTSSITSVKLRLYCVDAAPLGGTFYSTGSGTSWIETTVTWNDAPPTVGASYGSLPTPVKVGIWYEVDLTSLVTGNGTYSLRITSTSTNGADYATKERPGAFAPQLVVTLGSS